VTHVTLYRAGPPVVSPFGAVSSWSTSRAHADLYTREPFYPDFGGPVMYAVTVAAPAVLDLRSESRAVALHDRVREAASVLKALGHEWVALPGLESPDGVRRPPYDEWLYLGDAELVVDVDGGCGSFCDQSVTSAPRARAGHVL